eukprot:gene3994-6444_t
MSTITCAQEFSLGSSYHHQQRHLQFKKFIISPSPYLLVLR